jgi:uroporphyrinogen III methyltransferase / synthase
MNLTNKRVLITRPRSQAEGFARALRAVGAQPLFFPVIEIFPPDDYAPLDFTIQNLEQYDRLIFTSVHGVEAFFKRLEALGYKKTPAGLRVAAVGSRTARFLSEHGLWTDHIPNEYISEAMLPDFGKNIYGKRFLFPQSNLARTVLANEIRSAGGLVTEVVAYRNHLSEPYASEIEALRAGVDIVTFTSPSTVRNFITILQRHGLDPLNLRGNPLFACIGPTTQQAAEEAGFSNLIVSSEYTTAGLIETLDNLIYTNA